MALPGLARASLLQPHPVQAHSAPLSAPTSLFTGPEHVLPYAQNAFHFSLTLFNFYSSSAHKLTIPSWGRPSLTAFTQALKHHAPLFCSIQHSSDLKLPCGIISLIVIHLPPFHCLSHESRTVSVLAPEAQYLFVKWVTKWLNWVRNLSIHTVTAIINWSSCYLFIQQRFTQRALFEIPVSCSILFAS